MILRGLLLAALVVAPFPAPADAEPPTKSEILGAVHKARLWLRKKQHRNGGWGGVRGTAAYGAGGQQAGSSEAGLAALAVYALLAAGDLSKDPVVRKGYDFIRHHKSKQTSMELSATLLALTATAKPKRKLDRPTWRRMVSPGRLKLWATKLIDRLVDRREKDAWRYNVSDEPTPGGDRDLFSTNLATCALFTAWRSGLKAKDYVWEGILAYTLSQQEASGPAVTYVDPRTNKKCKAHARGFAYILDADVEGWATGSTTACGLANIAIARSALSHLGMGPEHERWKQRDDLARIETALDDGIAWLIRHWRVDANPDHARRRVNHFCWLWNLQCAMDALGLEKLGEIDWYGEGARMLLNRQHEDGHWASKGTWKPDDVLDTCFAMLFLTRATRKWVQRVPD